MAKIAKISEIHPTLGFTEFDMLEKYRKSFHESEFGSLHSMFPFESIAKETGLSQPRLGRRNCFSPSAKITLVVIMDFPIFRLDMIGLFIKAFNASLFSILIIDYCL